MADMVASVPEETKRTCSTGVRPTISSARSTSASVGAPYDVPRVSASATAAMTSGCAWPSSIGPQEPTRSTYSRPSTSVSRAPAAERMKRGVPPTARKARTGEFTPPAVTAHARANRASDRSGLTGPLWPRGPTGRQSRSLAVRIPTSAPRNILGCRSFRRCQEGKPDPGACAGRRLRRHGDPGGRSMVRFGRAQKAFALLPLAVLSAAWTAGLANTGSDASASPAQQTLPDGTRVPTDAVRAPASLTAPRALGPGVAGHAHDVLSTASASGIRAVALVAYQRAATIIDAADRTCHLPWELTAAIGRVESDHGRVNGNVLTAKGIARPGIFGPALDG